MKFVLNQDFLEDDSVKRNQRASLISEDLYKSYDGLGTNHVSHCPMRPQLANQVHALSRKYITAQTFYRVNIFNLLDSFHIFLQPRTAACRSRFTGSMFSRSPFHPRHPRQKFGGQSVQSFVHPTAEKLS